MGYDCGLVSFPEHIVSLQNRVGNEAACQFISS